MRGKLEKLKSVQEIKIGEQIITNTTEIAEQFNLYFSNIGKDLATEIPPARSPSDRASISLLIS